MRLSLRNKRLLLIIVLAASLTLTVSVFNKEVRNAFYTFSAPLHRTFWRTGSNIANFLEAFVKSQKIQSEMEVLRLENQALLGHIASLKAAQEENEELREALGIELEKDFSITLARVVSKDNGQDFLLIDAGLRDGITEQMPVITAQKVLVGRVDEVYRNFSKIMLISHNKSSFDAHILRLADKKAEQENNITGIIKGGGKFHVSFDLLLQEADVSQGDIIVTSSFGGIFPAKLLVGTINEVEKSDVELFQRATVTPFLDIRKIDLLFVITDHIGGGFEPTL